ncbi:MAG: transglycosylase domain-containing protein [Candidatus Kerfeldbacteria bacterium]
MPIPQLEPKRKPQEPGYARDSSVIRNRRSAEQPGTFETPQQFKKISVRDASSHPSAATMKKKKEPKAKKERSSLKKRIYRRLWQIGIVVAAIGVASFVGLYIWVARGLADITDLDKRAIVESSKIYARDGETLLYEVGDNKRTDVTIDQISDPIEWATIALEDQTYYEHSGIKVTSIIRAGLSNVLHLDTGGGGASTLTQQFIKNAVLTSERTYTRKIKEALLALRIEQKYTKEEILEMYLNEVYYGANFQGVETSARGFFGKSAAEVTLAEAATLAALPNDPVLLPADPERLKGRRDYALDQMAKLGYITQEEADAAKQDELVIKDEITAINAPHFVFYVRSYLEDKYGQTTVRKGGLRVITTLDWDKQQKAEQAITDGIAKVESYGGSNAALVSLDAHTGQILAMVGSRDYWNDEYDGQVNVTTSFRQPGSSFKPVIYLAAFLKGYTPDTRVFDIETDFPTETSNYHPRNYDLSQRGSVSLRYALGQSLNIPAVKLLYLVGVGNALDIAEKLGYSSFGDRSRFGLAVVLGGGEVTLLEHTNAFATFAREGEYHRPISVLKVEDRAGDVLEEWENNPIQAVDNEAVRTLNSVLSDSSARGGFYDLNLPDRVVAAKTGTTNDYRDAWTVGYTPSIATGVWAGNNDNSEMARGAAGLVIAAPIWNAFMQSVLAGTPAEAFNAPTYTAANAALAGQLEKTESRSVDTVTGELIPEECVADYPSQYVTQKDFKEVHTILYYIDKNNPTGPAPSNPAADPMFNNWEAVIQSWAKADERKFEYLTDSTPKADCSMRSTKQQPSVAITSPDANESYKKKTFYIEASVKPGDGRVITTVDYYIDGSVLVDSQAGQTISGPLRVNSSYTPQNLTTGTHTVTVRVRDDKGNTAEDSVTFKYEAPAG